jgi:hypothetical protein
LLDGLADLVLLAPFLADHDARERGRIRYSVYERASSPNVRSVSSFIRNKGFSEDFAGNWMLVAEWRDIPVFPGNRDEVSA